MTANLRIPLLGNAGYALRAISAGNDHDGTLGAGTFRSQERQ